MTSVLTILNELAADASGNAKKAILGREKNNAELKAVFAATYNPYITYGIKQIPPYTSCGASGPLDLVSALGQLKRLSDRTATGHAAIDHLKDILERCNADDATVIERVIQRDLRCGATDTSANKIWPGLIPTFEVLLCSKDTSNIVYPAFAQEKGDGLRCHLAFDGKNCRAYSRSGKEIMTHGAFDKYASMLMEAGEVWDGELLFYKNGKCMDRKTGNGFGNKAIKGTISKQEAEMMVLLTWGIVDFSSTIKYKDILANMNTRFQAAGQGNIIPCPTELVADEAEAQEFYVKMRKAGKEGAVVKNLNLLWEGKRVKGAGKMKAIEEADLVVVAYEEGTGKNVGRLGALVCETADGKIRVNVGTGFSDAQRIEYFSPSIVGKVIAAEYNEKIKDKSGPTWSLFLPRFVEVREDKDVANTFDELK